MFVDSLRLNFLVNWAEVNNSHVKIIWFSLLISKKSPFKFIFIFPSFTSKRLSQLYFFISVKYRLWKDLKANNLRCKISMFTFKKEPFADVLQKRCSETFYKFHRKTSVLESCNKVVGLHPCNIIKKRLQHRCFPVKYAKFIRTPFLKNICGWRLLSFFIYYLQNEFPILNQHLYSFIAYITFIGSPFSTENEVSITSALGLYYMCFE